MKHSYIIQTGHPRLLVFFAGWASDPTPFQDYRPAGRDYVVCYDYRTLENDFIPHGTYHEADIVAWSMGVWAASHVVPMLDVPIGKSIAINGTPYPIDAGKGIPPAIWQGTLDNLSPLSLHKFTRRMCADTEAFHRFLRVTCPPPPLPGNRPSWGAMTASSRLPTRQEPGRNRLPAWPPPGLPIMTNRLSNTTCKTYGQTKNSRMFRPCPPDL